MKYGLIAEKLGHSFSSEIHRAIGGYEYELCELKRGDLRAFLEKRDFEGINVTIPYKTEVIPYLDVLDKEAEKIGAVNTVINHAGKLCGFNTDYTGMKRLILRTGGDVRGKKALIFGSGGTAKTARAVLEDLGAPETVTVRRDARDGAVTYKDAYTLHADAEVLVNTTPCGMFPHGGELPCDIDGAPLDLERFPRLSLLIDVIYNPLRTALVLEARARGIRAAGGLYMLVAQAVAASEYFFDRPCPEGTADAVYRKILEEKENIVLTGMPGSGKSTVGRLIAQKSGRTFVDTDELIVKREEKSIPGIFSGKGEGYFRDVESAVIADLSAKTGLVVATGGGAVLRSENVKALKRNGRLYFIDRPKSCLVPTGDRPLGDTKEKIEKLYFARIPVYRETANETVAIENKDENAAAEMILAAHKRYIYEC